tara:strand:- start:7726 stop:8496 length:771 start_codon:yes stop_codon:yes gene_type:complete
MNILDIKSNEELLKHKSNFYCKFLNNRKDIINNNKFSILDIPKSDIFLVNIHKFSGFEGSYYFSGNDPLVNTSLQLLKDINIRLEDSYLFKYYQEFQPNTYGDVYHLNINNKLHQLQATNHFHPWMHYGPTNQFRCGLFGPKHITNVEHRITRLKNIINNINKYGYIPSNDDIIEGYILLKDDDYRFLITGGHHRVAVLTAMYMNDNSKFNDILVKYEKYRTNIKIVKEKEVENWPGVKSGYLNTEDALEIFNKYF